MSILYIHIPFCKRKCPYCDFFSITGATTSIKDQYTNSLIKELRSKRSYLNKGVDTVYLGGGSPLLIGRKNLKKIFCELKYILKRSSELTIEINPEHLSELHNSGHLIKELGINRVSIGVQTTNRTILKTIKRSFDEKTLLNNINWFFENNIDVSLDFMFGLPGQKIFDLKKDIEFVKKVRPQHVSFYMFTVNENYGNYSKCPKEVTIIKMFEIIHQELEGAGYEHYEVSNFALRGKKSRHNSAYWEHKGYIGIGAGAHSFSSIEKKRYWNTKDIRTYIKKPLLPEGAETLDKENLRIEKIMLGLRMLKKGVREELVEQKNLKELLDQGMVKQYKGRVLIDIKSLPIIDEIISKLSI